MKETIRVLLSEEEVDRRIKEVADQINRDYAGKEVHLNLRFKRQAYSLSASWQNASQCR